MRVSDYLFQTLADWGVRHVFFVSGGGAMHLNDALGREHRIKYVCNLHEQAAAIAAEGYARITNLPGVINVTTGPGGTNALTGVAGAWLDSIPMIIISGQIKNQTCIASYPQLKLRQLGDQELNIIDMVKPVTKYAVMVTSPQDIRYHLERAWFLARSGRPGPVWLDIPLDVQAANIDPENLASYNGKEELDSFSPLEPDPVQMEQFLQKLAQAERPVVIAGNGVRLADACSEFLQMVEQLNLPVLTSLSGIDLIPSDSPLFFGRPGILGERSANFILQNSDFLLVLGTRMSIRTIGYAFGTIARKACKVMVDIDENELLKPTFVPDLKIRADLKKFIQSVLHSDHHPKEVKPKAYQNWFAYCNRLKERYPVVLPEHRERKDYVSSYYFPELLGQCLQGDEIIVTGNGTAYTSTFQTISLKKGVRMFGNVGCASMGYDLPAAIGAAFATSGKNVICITGDGSLQMNIQELQTVLNYNLPIKLFVYNNEGYLSIKLTQRSFFKGHFVGSTKESGVILPDMMKLASAYGLKTFRMRNNAEAQMLLPEIMKLDGPVFCEVMTDPFEVLGPKASSSIKKDGSMVSQPLENLAPFLPKEEFLSNMLIEPWDE